MIRLKKLDLFAQIMLMLLCLLSIIVDAKALVLCWLLLAVMAGSFFLHHFGNSIFRQSPRRKIFMVSAALLYMSMIVLNFSPSQDLFSLAFYCITMLSAAWYITISYSELQALLFR